MSKFRCTRSLLIGSVLFLGGCKQETASIVGNWTCQSDLMGMDLQITADYLADGSFKSVSKAQPAPNQPIVTATDTGTWKLEGDRLTILLTDVDWKFSGGSEAMRKRAETRFASSKPTILDQSNAHPTRTIRWNGRDEFSYSQESKTYTYRRQK